MSRVACARCGDLAEVDARGYCSWCSWILSLRGGHSHGCLDKAQEHVLENWLQAHYGSAPWTPEQVDSAPDTELDEWAQALLDQTENCADDCPMRGTAPPPHHLTPLVL